MRGIIYMYTFPDGKVYIGQTRRIPEKRMREHTDVFAGPTNTGFWEAYQRFGKYDYKELYSVERNNEDELVAELNVAETFFIKVYKSNDPDHGYNKKSYATVRTKTGVILHKKFHEILDKVLKPRMEVYKSAVNKIWNTKERLNDDERQLVTTKYQDRNIWDSHGYDFDDLKNNREDEETLFYLEEYLGFIRFLITNDTEEEVYKYLAEHFAEILEEERNKNAIVQIDKEGNPMREFYSFNEICEAFNIVSPNNVRNVLRGKQKSAYGFLWKYKKDLT